MMNVGNDMDITLNISSQNIFSKAKLFRRKYTTMTVIKELIICGINDTKNFLNGNPSVYRFITIYDVKKFIVSVISQAQAILSNVLKYLAAIRNPITVTAVLHIPV